ncbi:MAG: hypothetical protein KDM91_14180, partial [Verrucomicrobiae bacterium]|nr:hypothetical protein [Verrucomicrobiae bacterium]
MAWTVFSGAANAQIVEVADFDARSGVTPPVDGATITKWADSTGSAEVLTSDGSTPNWRESGTGNGSPTVSFGGFPGGDHFANSQSPYGLAGATSFTAVATFFPTDNGLDLGTNIDFVDTLHLVSAHSAGGGSDGWGLGYR